MKDIVYLFIALGVTFAIPVIVVLGLMCYEVQRHKALHRWKKTAQYVEAVFNDLPKKK